MESKTSAEAGVVTDGYPGYNKLSEIFANAVQLRSGGVKPFPLFTNSWRTSKDG